MQHAHHVTRKADDQSPDSVALFGNIFFPCCDDELKTAPLSSTSTSALLGLCPDLFITDAPITSSSDNKDQLIACLAGNHKDSIQQGGETVKITDEFSFLEEWGGLEDASIGSMDLDLCPLETTSSSWHRFDPFSFQEKDVIRQISPVTVTVTVPPRHVPNVGLLPPPPPPLLETANRFNARHCTPKNNGIKNKVETAKRRGALAQHRKTARLGVLETIRHETKSHNFNVTENKGAPLSKMKTKNMKNTLHTKKGKSLKTKRDGDAAQQEKLGTTTTTTTTTSTSAAKAKASAMSAEKMKDLLSGLQRATGRGTVPQTDKHMYAALVQAAHSGSLTLVDYDSATLGTQGDHLNSVDRAVEDGFIVNFPTMDACGRAIKDSERDVFANGKPVFFTFVNNPTRCKDSTGSVITGTTVMVVIVPADKAGGGPPAKVRTHFEDSSVLRVSSLGGNPEFYFADEQAERSPFEHEVMSNTGIDKIFTFKGAPNRLRTTVFKLVRAGTKEARNHQR